MALALTRKVNEKIQLGEHITLTVTKIKGNRVHIAIDAPDEVKILRGELTEVTR